MSNPLLRMLAKLNSKERFFLVGYALGNREFRLGKDFRKTLGQRLNIKIPSDSFCAMDYHLDWIFAALYGNKHGYDKAHSNADRFVRAQQQDVDLLIAFEGIDTVHLVLIEAKGATAWCNDQSRSKRERLTQIFGKDGNQWSGVRPYFVLTSPRKPVRLNTVEWPPWMLDSSKQPSWIPLPISSELNAVTRCDVNERRDKDGEYWNIVKR